MREIQRAFYRHDQRPASHLSRLWLDTVADRRRRARREPGLVRQPVQVAKITDVRFDAGRRPRGDPRSLVYREAMP